MATVTEITRETATLVEREPRNDWGFFLLEEVSINSTAFAAPTATQRESAYLSSLAYPNQYPIVRETAGLNDTPSSSVRSTVTFRETAALVSRAQGGVRLFETVREQAQLNDTTAYDLAYTLRESAELNDTATIVGTTSRTLRETVQITSRISNLATLTIRETATLNDVVSAGNRGRNDLRDSAQLNDAVRSAILVGASIRDAASVRSLVSTRLSTSPVLRERFYVADKPVTPASGRAYTCSVVTWGMSVWLSFPFETMAGDFVSTNNLWRMGGLADNGTPFESYIRTGVLDMGADRFKRISAVYATGYSDSPLTISVIGDVNGSRETFDYDMQLRDQEDYRNNRAIIGKGFRSRYIQMKIGATSVQYKLLDASADVAVTARRV